MQRTAASDASLVIGFNPVFVAILSMWFFSHRMSSEGLIGVCLSFTGILLIFLASPNVQIDFNERIMGNSLIMFGAFTYAIYVNIEEQGTQRAALFQAQVTGDGVHHLSF